MDLDDGLRDKQGLIAQKPNRIPFPIRKSAFCQCPVCGLIFIEGPYVVRKKYDPHLGQSIEQLWMVF